jgi:hypothetical protein
MKKCILLSVMVFLVAGLSAQTTDTTTVQNQELPAVILLDSDFDESSTSVNDVSTLLQSSRDVFSSIAAYNFGSLRYRVRGNDSKYMDVMINGIIMNDPEIGRPFFSNWGGLNDAMRNSASTEGIGMGESGFGGIAGMTNISTRASNYRRQISVSYANSNRSYNNRVMASAGTGMMNNGWAIAASASGRYSLNGYTEGTFYQAYSYFLAAEKRINNKHNLNFTVFAAPSVRGGSSPVVQEAYDLAGTNFYNPNWGYQTLDDGTRVKRNSRVSSYHQPMFQLTHYWTPNEKTTFTTSAYYWFGRGGQTSLEWGEAADPRPDYYRNLPSYFLTNATSTQAYLDQLAAWENQDPSICQIDWDKLYEANLNHLATVNNANGIENNTVVGKASKYIVAERRYDKNQGGASSYFKHEFMPNLHLNGGLNFAISRTHYFQTVEDLLGGDFYFDVNKYAENLESSEYQVNLHNPNHVAKVGDIISYNYFANKNKVNLWAQLNYIAGNFDFYVAAQGSFTQIWRTGKFQSGSFPNNSYGDSDKNNFIDPAVKTGVTYAFNGRNYLVANVAYLHQAPQFRDIYIAPRTRNTLVSNPESERIFSTDLSYLYRSPAFKARLSAYYTTYSNLVWNRSFYCENVYIGSDNSGSSYKSEYVNFIMTGIKQKSVGLEFGAEYNVTPTVTLQAAAAHGIHTYKNRPSFSVYDDNSSQPYIEDQTVYLKNYHVANGPKTVGSFGIKYNAPKNWWISLNANYFDNMYFDVNPYNHTEYGMSHYAEGDIRIDEVLKQTKLNSAFTLDFYGGISKTIRGYYCLLNLSINNLTNNKNIVLYGYEQLRFNAEDPDMFPAKYSYLYGLNYFISLTIRK